MLAAYRPTSPSKFLADAVSCTGPWSVHDRHDLGGVPPIIRDQPAHAIEALTVYDLRNHRAELDRALKQRRQDKSMRVLLHGKPTAVNRRARTGAHPAGSGGDPAR